MSSTVRRHQLPQGIELHCLACGTRTRLTVERLCEDDATPYCTGCRAPLDPRLERDVRAIARAIESITHFLPEGTLVTRPIPEKSWAIGLVWPDDGTDGSPSPTSAS